MYNKLHIYGILLYNETKYEEILMDKSNKKLPELQVFSGIAILCVVLIHNNAIYLLSVLNLQSYNDANFTVRFLDNLINAAVSMFIFISGYKYAVNNIDTEYKKYAIKTIKKVFKPFLIISLIFIIKNNIVTPGYFNNIKNMLSDFRNIFKGYNYAYQLWYIPMYLFISLTYPLMCKLFNNDKFRIFIILSIIFTQELLERRFGLLVGRPFNFVYYYLFFEMGLIFCKYDIKNKIKRYDILIISTYLISSIILTINPALNLYSLIEYYIMWPLSVLAYYLLSLRLVNSKLFRYLGKYSFYIYLLHAPIMCGRIFDTFKSLAIYNSIIYIFIITALTIACSIIVYKVIEHTFINSILFSPKHSNVSYNKDFNINI